MATYTELKIYMDTEYPVDCDINSLQKLWTAFKSDHSFYYYSIIMMAEYLYFVMTNGLIQLTRSSPV